MGELGSVKLSLFRKFLKEQGLKKTGGKGDHEKWSKNDLSRPVILQVKNKNIPAFHIRTNLKTLGISVKDFLNWKNNQ